MYKATTVAYVRFVRAPATKSSAETCSRMREQQEAKVATSAIQVGSPKEQPCTSTVQLRGACERPWSFT